MTALGQLAAKRLEGVPVYQPGRSLGGLITGKLSSNESVLGPGPYVKGALSLAASTVGTYPTEGQLRDLLAVRLAVSDDRFTLSNGSDEICFLTAQVFLGPGMRAVVGDPAYAIDATVSVLSGADLVRVPLQDGAHDIAAMITAAQDANVVWLPTPHNPTGVVCTQEQVETLLQAVPDTCLVVLDEAYRDYVDPELQFDSIALLDRFPNLLVQRTMSKSWALAGVRLGYAVGHPDVIGALRRVRAPFSVNALALAAGVAALQRPEWQEMSVARIKEGRNRLHRLFDELGIHYYPSQANFVTAQVAHADVAGPLAQAGISVRPGDNLGLPGWTRFTVGWAPTMTEMREVLRTSLPPATLTTRSPA